ncbi:uncharacterized protein LOC111642814 [Copidosoma floridanum]|uniref:uncharacterized protein LOC111642814 n=1 Tax=Copidosoma floridanum TaxID=29053 RepID=UPI000C6FBB14|nr:uncharacterized protein LOC111642814 [Copidosoma floridanum]
MGTKRGEDPPLLQKLNRIEGHPFKYLDDLGFMTITEAVPNTEVIDALHERGYINPTRMNNEERGVGEAEMTNARRIKIVHIDLAILNLTQWGYFVDTFEEIFKDIRLAAVFYTNTLVISPADQRFKIIREYHEAAIGGHRGMDKTYNRIAKDYDWRNMHPDVRQVILGCTSCQTKKLVRIKTKQAMLITDTWSRPFEKIFIDFYGPISKPSANQYAHILSTQDWLTKMYSSRTYEESNSQRNIKSDNK